MKIEPGMMFEGLTVLDRCGVAPSSVFEAAFRAREPGGREVALRTRRVTEPSDAAVVEAFFRKAAIAVRLDHPHILPVLGFGQSEGQLWATVRGVVPESRNQDVRSGTLDRPQSLGILRAVASAIDHLHAKDLVHGFVSPLVIQVSEEGVFLDMGWMEWIGDRALAARWNVDSRTIMGNPLYDAVEHIAGRPIGPPSDIYSLGNIAFEMLAGQRAFEADTSVGVSYRKLKGELSSPPQDRLPLRALEVLRRCLSVEPRDRWTSATAFVDALGEC